MNTSLHCSIPVTPAATTVVAASKTDTDASTTTYLPWSKSLYVDELIISLAFYLLLCRSTILITMQSSLLLLQGLVGDDEQHVVPFITRKREATQQLPHDTRSQRLGWTWTDTCVHLLVVVGNELTAACFSANQSAVSECLAGLYILI